MGASCRCGAAVRHAYEHLGCIQCGAVCCSACAYQLESTSYCSTCAEALLELPWASALHPGGLRAASLTR